MAKKTQKTDKQEERIAEEMVNEASEEQKEVIDTEATDEKEVKEPEESVEEKTIEDELSEKLAEFQDKYLRLSAEYDNYRKRTLREKVEMQENAKQDVFIHILPVIDDLERALAAIVNAKDIEAVKHGMELIYTKFSNFLKQQGVKEIEAMDQELNTDIHEAVTKIKVESKKKKGKVVDVIEKGYLLKDKVIRFAKVVIGE